MRRLALLSILVLLVLLATSATQPVPGRSSPTAIDRAVSGIRSEPILAHMRFLSDDLLEGRATGTRGYDLAAAYVASQFQALGLTPAGDGERYLQPVPMRRAVVAEPQCGLSLVSRGREQRFQIGSDYIMGGDWRRERTAFDASLVYAGFGVTAPDLGYDDYAGIDVRGKVVVLLNGAPKSFPNDQRALYSWNQTKDRNAAERGAIGILTFRTPDDSLRATWPRTMRQGRLPGYRWLAEDGEPHNTHPQFEIGATLNRSVVEAMFAGAPATPAQIYALAADGRNRSFDLLPKLRARRTTRHTRIESPNVAALLPGSDPVLKNEVVVISGHLDHLGISAPVNGDSINNGAFDNATGIGAMLEIAGALRRMPIAPKRSILFLAVTAEEKGLQGSDYFAQHPSIRQRIVANINLDMLLMTHPFTRVVAFGAEHSSLGGAVARAAAASGVKVKPDPMPEEVIFVRSDQFSFVRRGVPAVFPVSSAATADEEVTDEHWRRNIYHSPQDQMSQPMDPESAAQFARFNLRLLLDVANAPSAPTWNAGDYFGTRYGGARP